MIEIKHKCDGIDNYPISICTNSERPDRVHILQSIDEPSGDDLITISHANLPIFIAQLKMYAESVGIKS
jgi:hypothetical protein